MGEHFARIVTEKQKPMVEEKKGNFAVGCWTDWNRPGASKKCGGVGWYRIVNPLSKAKNAQAISGEHIKIGGEVTNAVENAKYLKGLGNVWFFKYIDDFNPVAHLLSAKRVVGAKLVVDADDDMFNVHPHNYAYQHHFPGSPKQKALSYLFENADAITVSTEALKKTLEKRFKAPIKILPNCIDTSIWDHKLGRKTKLNMFKSDKETDDVEIVEVETNPENIRIGWICSASHEQDAPEVYNALKEILEKYKNVELWCVGWRPTSFEDFPRTYWIQGTSDYEDYPKFLCELGLDISIAPLIPDEFNKSKSNIKWMEASMAGIPTVASNYEPYHCIDHYKTGYLAKNDREWVKYLSWLIEEKETREKIAIAAKKEVLEKYTSEKIVPMYEEFISSL